MLPRGLPGQVSHLVVFVDLANTWKRNDQVDFQEYGMRIGPTSYVCSPRHRIEEKSVCLSDLMTTIYKLLEERDYVDRLSCVNKMSKTYVAMAMQWFSPVLD